MPQATRSTPHTGRIDGLLRAQRRIDAELASWVALLAFAVSVVAGPRTVHAWTDTHVRGAEADLRVLDGGQAQVKLAVNIHIGGGWLSELELPGIPPDAQFDPANGAALVAETGETYPPTLVLRRGVWRVTFASRRTAPWRGDYVLTLKYSSHLAALNGANEKSQRLQWAMPPWRSGIEAARIRIDAPAASASADHVETGIAYSVTKEVHADRVVITHERTHLPRDTEWVVTFDVPKAAGAARTNQPPVAAAPAKPDASAPTPAPGIAWWPLAVLVLCSLKRRAVEAATNARGLQVRPLVPGVRPPVRGAAKVCLALAACWVGATQPMAAAIATAGLVALSIDRAFEPRPSSVLRWSPADAAESRPSLWRRLRAGSTPHALLDITSPLGGLSLVGTFLGLGWLERVSAVNAPIAIVLASLVTPLWCTGTRLHFPWTGVDMARVLEAWRWRNVRALETVLADTPRPLVGYDDTGIDRDARMPFQLVAPEEGVQSLDLVVVTDAGTLRRQVALLVRATTGSPADHRLGQVPLSTRRRLSNATIHVIGAAQVLAALSPPQVATDGATSPANERGLEAA